MGVTELVGIETMALDATGTIELCGATIAELEAIDVVNDAEAELARTLQLDGVGVGNVILFKSLNGTVEEDDDVGWLCPYGRPV
jgi:hypothetical protein